LNIDDHRRDIYPDIFIYYYKTMKVVVLFFKYFLHLINADMYYLKDLISTIGKLNSANEMLIYFL